MVRILLSRAAAVLLAAALAAAGPPSPAVASPDRTYTYEVRVKGTVGTDVEAFAAHAAATLTDPRGWSMGGSLGFTRVASGGDFTLWLAEPAAVRSFSSACSAEYSCRVGRHVVINDLRWRTASRSWTRSLDEYQHYVVLHETGHWLGQGHLGCPGAGRPAPVMQQQSISLQGCAANVWPLDSERAVVARRHGVAIRTSPPPPPDVYTDLHGSVHAEAVRRLAAQGVVTGYPDGSFRPNGLLTRGQAASTLTRALGLAPTGAHDFPDLAGSVHADAARALADAGLAAGYADGRFGPADDVLRGQLAALLARALELPTDDASCAPPDTADSVHAGAVCAVLRAGVATGQADGSFAPAATVTRGQAASFVVRMLDLREQRAAEPAPTASEQPSEPQPEPTASEQPSEPQPEPTTSEQPPESGTGEPTMTGEPAP